VPYCACDFAAALERQEEKHQGRHGHQQIDGIGIFQQGEIGKHRQPQLLKLQLNKSVIPVIHMGLYQPSGAPNHVQVMDMT